MNIPIELGDLASWTTCLVALLTLLAIWRQLVSLRHSIEGGTYHHISQSMIDIDRWFAENPELRPYFYSKKSVDEIDPILRERLYATAEMLVDFFYNVYFQRNQLPESASLPYSEWMCRLYQTSPLLQEFVPTGTYHKEFVSHLANEHGIGC